MVLLLRGGDLATLAGRERLDHAVEPFSWGRRVVRVAHDPESGTVADPALDGVEIRRRDADVAFPRGGERERQRRLAHDCRADRRVGDRAEREPTGEAHPDHRDRAVAIEGSLLPGQRTEPLDDGAGLARRERRELVGDAEAREADGPAQGGGSERPLLHQLGDSHRVVPLRELVRDREGPRRDARRLVDEDHRRAGVGTTEDLALEDAA